MCHGMNEWRAIQFAISIPEPESCIIMDTRVLNIQGVFGSDSCDYLTKTCLGGGFCKNKRKKC